MHATGTLYMSKKHPIVGTDRGGAFRVELVLVDNMGRNRHTGREDREAYRVFWAGPEAQAFWAEHGASIKPGTPLHVELQRLQAAPGPQCFPPMPELRARAVSIQMAPQGLPAKREQLPKAEHCAQPAAAHA